MFENILGHEPLKAYFIRALEQNRLPHALLFLGDDGIGKRLFATQIAEAIIGKNSPDLHVLTPEGKSGLYSIDSLREMIDVEHESSYQAKGKVFILEDVDRMQPAAANALLKTLEEPTEETTFILLTSKINEILPTIVSRCSLIRFHPLSQKLIEQALLDRGVDTKFAKLSLGSLGRALQQAEYPQLEEQRELLFEQLSSNPSYLDLSLAIDKIETLCKVEEDSYKTAQWGDHLFSYILMWYRDQEARAVGAPLFFPEAKAGKAMALSKVETIIEKSRLALSRNIKLSYCLKEALFELLATSST